jgi:predicted TIM-barrel fold metal-dependent hydrolase
VPTIDVHAHVATPGADAILAGHPELVRQFAEDATTAGPASTAYNREQIGALIPKLTDPTLRLAAMDAAGIDIQTVSATPAPRHWTDHELAQRYTRASNEEVAAHCAAAAERLRPVAGVPLHLPDLAIAELSYAVDQLGAVGVQISTSAGVGKELDHEDLEPFWAWVEEHEVPVLIHPWGCSLGARLDIGYMFNHVGNPTETSVALSRLIFGGVLDRHPGLRLWAAHGGGWLPSYSGRADHAWEGRADARTCARRPSEYLHEIFVDALVYTPRALRFLVDQQGADHVTIGTDYPFDMGVEDPLDRLRAAGLSDDEIDGITSRSAAALFGDRLTNTRTS